MCVENDWVIVGASRSPPGLVLTTLRAVRWALISSTRMDAYCRLLLVWGPSANMVAVCFFVCVASIFQNTGPFCIHFDHLGTSLRVIFEHLGSFLEHFGYTFWVKNRIGCQRWPQEAPPPKFPHPFWDILGVIFCKILQFSSKSELLKHVSFSGLFLCRFWHCLEQVEPGKYTKIVVPSFKIRVCSKSSKLNPRSDLKWIWWSFWVPFL